MAYTTTDLARMSKITTTLVARKLRAAGIRPIRKTVTAKQTRMLWGNDAFEHMAAYVAERAEQAETPPPPRVEVVVPPEAHVILDRLDKVSKEFTTAAIAQHQSALQIASLQSMFANVQSTLNNILDVITQPKEPA